MEVARFNDLRRQSHSPEWFRMIKARFLIWFDRWNRIRKLNNSVKWLQAYGGRSEREIIAETMHYKEIEPSRDRILAIQLGLHHPRLDAAFKLQAKISRQNQKDTVEMVESFKKELRKLGIKESEKQI